MHTHVPTRTQAATALTEGKGLEDKDAKPNVRLPRQYTTSRISETTSC